MSNAVPSNNNGFFSSLLRWPGSQQGQQQRQAPVNNGNGSSMQPGGQQQQPQGQQQQPQGQQEPQQNSPMDSFKDLWQTDPNQQQNADPFSAPLFNTDPSKIVEVAGQQDFLRNIPQELRDKAKGGDPDAMMQIVNNAVQQSLALSLQLQTATVEQAGKSLGSRFNQSFPTQFKKHSLGAQASSNPAMDHPALKPLVDQMRDRFVQRYPDERPEQIHQRLEQYFNEVGTAFGAKPGSNDGGNPTQQPGNGVSSDFENWG